MKKINNKSINSGLKILSILAFSLLVIPMSASAAFGTNFSYSTGNHTSNSNTRNNYAPTYYYVNPVTHSWQTGPIDQQTIYYQNYNPTPSTPVVYSNTVNTSKTVATNTTTTKRTITKKSPSQNEAIIVTTATITPSSNSDTYKNLAANTFFGSYTFLPSGLIQWILLAIFILIIIILTRIIFGAKENYYTAPLKHE